MDYKAYLKRLHEEVWFQDFVKDELLPGMPNVQEYNPSQDNTERWKYDCAMREGYRECLRKLGIGVKNVGRK